MFFVSICSFIVVSIFLSFASSGHIVEPAHNNMTPEGEPQRDLWEPPWVHEKTLVEGKDQRDLGPVPRIALPSPALQWAFFFLISHILFPFFLSSCCSCF